MSDEKSTEVVRVQAILAKAWDAMDTVKDYLRDMELEKLNDVERIEIDRSSIPEGAVLLEAYLHNSALVVMYEEALGELGENHNCDEMGCGTGSHVWARIPLDAMSRIAELEAERDTLKARVEQEVAEETSMSGYVVMPYSGTTCGHWCIRCGKPIGHEAYWINDVGPICTGCDKSP
ncbi:MAG: hypothetical protein WDA42_08320 [Candidatus Bathyarchaeia archaeon]